jgi:formylglycine-generating enzyme required for sulfatase activity
VKSGGCGYRPKPRGGNDNTPVHGVSWNDAQQYVRWLAKVTNRPYRLPSEAEWEYAARAQSETRFWWGSAAGSGHANCKDCGGAYARKFPAAAGSFAANPFGLHDTSGGVWEWVEDCWHADYQGAPRDGSVWQAPNCGQRVLRGGSWRNDSSYLHSASRFFYDASVRYSANGFRVALTLR